MKKHRLIENDIVNGNYEKKLEHPIIYLSRMFNKHEVNYQPTELEITEIV